MSWVSIAPRRARKHASNPMTSAKWGILEGGKGHTLLGYVNRGKGVLRGVHLTETPFYPFFIDSTSLSLQNSFFWAHSCVNYQVYTWELSSHEIIKGVKRRDGKG